MKAALPFLFLALAAGQDPRSRFSISTAETFDPEAIPAYRGNNEAVYRHIDSHLDHHLGEIQRWLRQPSVSAQNQGIAEMAEMVRSDLKAIGFQETEIEKGYVDFLFALAGE
jgi:hypothetical protein